MRLKKYNWMNYKLKKLLITNIRIFFIDENSWFLVVNNSILYKKLRITIVYFLDSEFSMGTKYAHSELLMLFEDSILL